MKVELMYIPACPNHAPVAEAIREVLREQGLPEEIVEVEVDNSVAAVALSFLGSPTVRIDGKDVEPGVEESGNYGVSCRTYLVNGKRLGVPEREWIRRAVVSAVKGR